MPEKFIEIVVVTKKDNDHLEKKWLIIEDLRCLAYQITKPRFSNGFVNKKRVT